jgi:glycosyltransferase involved in cell wall biosynthesis
VDETASRRVMIVEGNPDGHRLYYASLLASTALEYGDRVTLATTAAALSSSEWSVHMGAVGDRLAVAELNDFSLDVVGNLADELEIDHVVVPDGDSFVFELSKGRRWSARGTVTALVMREKGQPSTIPGLAVMKTLAKNILLQLANLGPRVEVRVLKSAPWRGFSMLPISRDPVTLTRREMTQDCGALSILPDGSFWFGIIGAIGHRKNLPLVAAAIASLNRPDVGLVVAGQIEDGVLGQALPYLERIREAGGRVKIIDRILSDSEIDRIIAELDCAVLAHSNDSPSGILGKAVAAGTRIVAAGASTLRSDCRHIGSGAEWVRLDEQNLSEALARATRKPPPVPTRLASAGDFASSLLGLRE